MKAVARLAELLLARNVVVAVAESCTGGGLGARLVRMPGASRWFAGGLVVYRNVDKTRELAVSEALLQTHGAVSAACVEQMAMAVARRFSVEVGVAISGIAGPDGGGIDKPVGLVYTGYAIAAAVDHERHVHSGERRQVQDAAVRTAIRGLIARL